MNAYRYPVAALQVCETAKLGKTLATNEVSPESVGCEGAQPSNRYKGDNTASASRHSSIAVEQIPLLQEGGSREELMKYIGFGNLSKNHHYQVQIELLSLPYSSSS